MQKRLFEQYKDNLNLGIIGNCRTAALINKEAEIVWLCMPEFNSYSIFAKILDSKKGGCFGITTQNGYKIDQEYIKKTNILCTTFSNNKNCFQVFDFMPRYKNEHGKHHYPPEVVRYIKLIRGKPKINIRYNPQFCYAQSNSKSIKNSKYIKSYSENGPYESMYLYSNIPFSKILDASAFTIKEDCYCWISYNHKIELPDIETAYLTYERTKVYWLDWCSRTIRFSQFKEEIDRSALVLKLLSFQKTGAILAAATTSIPESIGEERNWDYRYCWIRDGSMILSTFSRIGHNNVVKRYIHFLLNIISYKNEKIQVMYGINGEKNLRESVLKHLTGYANSKPVRIGNAAYRQQQNDVYGVLMEIIYQTILAHDEDIGFIEDLWTMVRTLMRTVEHVWSKPDKGIWEKRGKRKHFVFSKVLCWVAVDRAIKIAHLFNIYEYSLQWSQLRDTIKHDIMQKGWNSKIESFTQSYGGVHLDAANLLFEPYGFISADDPMYISTVRKTFKQLCVDGLMYRYINSDDFGKPSSSFTVCTFWMIDSLFKIGEKEKAVELFKNILSLSNHLGLYSEDIDMHTKKLLGNFPQGYSHLALINTAITLSKFKK